MSFIKSNLQRHRNVVLLGNDFEYRVPEKLERAFKSTAEEFDSWVFTPHGFAHDFKRGIVGIIGTAGTGIQHVGCMLHKKGIGISQIYSVGRRDMSDSVSGAETFRALKVLARDPKTGIIVLLLKPISKTQRRCLLKEIRAVSKPIIIYLLGEDRTLLHQSNIFWAGSFEEVVKRIQVSLRVAGNEDDDWLSSYIQVTRSETSPLLERQIRGYFSGGSCCDEAVSILQRLGLKVHSNSPVLKSAQLSFATPRSFNKNSHVKHWCIDLGGGIRIDGKLHQPMVNLRAKCNWMYRAATERQGRIILFDVFLGYGSHPNPAEPLVAAIRSARQICTKRDYYPVFIATVIGIDRDPQDLDLQMEALSKAGVILAPNVTKAAELAERLVHN